MNKQWKEKSKIVLAIMVAVAVFVGAIPLTQPLVSEAAMLPITTAEENNKVRNGDFESGLVGDSVKNWGKTAMARGLTADGLSEDSINAYLKSYDLITAEMTDGNRVASLTKKGAGYVAMTSESFSVTGGSTYWVSYKYFYQQMINAAVKKGKEITDNDFHGISLAVMEYDAEGNTTWTKLSSDNSYGDGKISASSYVMDDAAQTGYFKSSAWTTIGKEYRALESTVRAELYIKIGAAAYVTGTVLFDDVTVSSNNNFEVANGDFESGRAGYTVKDWTKTAMARGLKTAEADGKSENEINAYLKSYDLITAEMEDGNRVASLTKTGAGYVAMTSESFSITGGKTYWITYKYFLQQIINAAVKKGKEIQDIDFHGISLSVKEYDAEGNATWTTLSSDTSYGDGRISATSYVMDATTQTASYSSTAWRTVGEEYRAKESTVRAEIYIKVGAAAHVTGTVLFDDVTVHLYDNYEVVNGDFNWQTADKDGGRQSGVGPAGWTSESTDQTGKKNDNNNFQNNYIATVEYEDNNAVVKGTRINKTAVGYSWILSSPIAVDEGESISASFRYKIDGYMVMKGKSAIFYYNKNGTELKRDIIALGSTSAGWTNGTTGDKTTPDGTAYVKIGFFIGGRRAHEDSDTYKNANGVGYTYRDNNGNWYDEFEFYFDDVVLQSDKKVKMWTPETCLHNGAPRTDVDATPYYTITQQTSRTDGHDTAWKLASTTDKNGYVGVTFYTQPIEVSAGASYTTGFDYYIDGLEENQAQISAIFNASYVVRYMDGDGKIINTTPTVVFATKEDTNEWKSGEVTFTTPDNAAALQVGLIIGANGTGRIPGVSYMWDNIVLLETEAYEEYIKDPAVTSSPLYKKTALFIGASTGSEIAAFAQSYSEMQVTDVCDSQKTTKEQLAANTSSAYDYLFLSIGKEELESGLSADKFAAILEELFADIALYYDELKVVCLLTADSTAYQAEAEVLATKWNVTMVSLGAYESAEMKWQEAIESAEDAETLDCYDIAGFGTYLEELFAKVKAAGVSYATNLSALDSILLKAEKCPDTDDDYQLLTNLASEVKQFISQFEDMRPVLKGATIALNDPNRLQFMANAPKQSLDTGVTVKQMGIIVTSEATTPTQYNVTYVKEGEAYGVVMEVKDVDPSVSYTAVAYIIYAMDGNEYIYYSNNNYTNDIGEKTVENGQCTKSVYEITRKVALKLADRTGTDFTAIGGKKNKNLIALATKESEISLYHVYQMLGQNIENLATWLNGGGVTR